MNFLILSGEIIPWEWEFHKFLWYWAPPTSRTMHAIWCNNDRVHILRDKIWFWERSVEIRAKVLTECFLAGPEETRRRLIIPTHQWEGPYPLVARSPTAQTCLGKYTYNGVWEPIFRSHQEEGRVELHVIQYL